MTLVRVKYLDETSTSQADGFVVLEDYPYLHVEGSGSSWVVKVTTVSAPTTQTATLTGTYTSRADAVTALNKLVTAAGQVLDITTI